MYKQLKMGHEWKDIINILNRKFFFFFLVKKTIWNKPELVFVKINSDGSYLEAGS